MQFCVVTVSSIEICAFKKKKFFLLNWFVNWKLKRTKSGFIFWDMLATFVVKI